jgi:hypothetical protein
MHKNKVWLGFLILVILVTLGNMGLATYRYLSYSRLQSQAPLLNFTTKIEEQGETYFYVNVDYTYQVNGKTYSGQSNSNERHFLNRWVAEEEIKALTAKPPKVWFDPHNPNYSSLIKKFPTRDIGSALALVGLLVYFFWIGLRVGGMKSMSK